MKTFVVYEVWTRAIVIKATDTHDAYTKGDPKPMPKELGLNLCNWHAIEVKEDK